MNKLNLVAKKKRAELSEIFVNKPFSMIYLENECARIEEWIDH